MQPIKAQLEDYKRIKTRGAFQIILEVPEEEAQRVTSALGWPMMGNSIWVCVVRLTDEVGAQNLSATESSVRKDDDLPNFLKRENV